MKDKEFGCQIVVHSPAFTGPLKCTKGIGSGEQAKRNAFLNAIFEFSESNEFIDAFNAGRVVNIEVTMS